MLPYLRRRGAHVGDGFDEQGGGSEGEKGLPDDVTVVLHRQVARGAVDLVGEGCNAGVPIGETRKGHLRQRNHLTLLKDRWANTLQKGIYESCYVIFLSSAHKP